MSLYGYVRVSTIDQDSAISCEKVTHSSSLVSIVSPAQ